jgi:hypothetical protein
MERWCRPFDYVDALDIAPPNPCESGVTRRAWIESRKRREAERTIVGAAERRHFGRLTGMNHAQGPDRRREG